MRAALISIAEMPSPVAGKSLARRQLDFALAAGCGRVIAIGHGASPEAIALRHAAEARGAKFQCIGDTHGLLGAVPAADELLVLAPGLLPEDKRAIEALERGSAVLVFPAGPGVAAGFERIDLERAWGGALVLPGRLVERLADLPADSEACAALLRIAMQARVAEKRLPELALAEGSWAIVGRGEDPLQRQQAWLKRNLPASGGTGAARPLARLALARLAIPLLSMPRAFAGLGAGVAVALAAAVGAASIGWAGTGLVLVALGALLGEFAAGFAHLREAPFGRAGKGRLGMLVQGAVDAALVACAALAIDGDWLHRLFPPLMLAAALHATRPRRWRHFSGLLGDRALLSLLFALAGAFELTELAVMLAGLTMLALDAAVFRARSRITQA